MKKSTIEKLSINLLPVEFELSKKEKKRQSIVVKISLGIMLIFVVMAASVLGMRIYQSVELKNVTQAQVEAKGKLISFADSENLVFALSTRMAGINTALAKESPQSQAFSLITSLTGSSITLTNFSVDKNGKVLIGGESGNLEAVKTFLSDLTNPVKNEGKIISAKIESLSLNKNGRLRFDISIVFAGGAVNTQ